jgi:transcriptional regulator with XRE-family HTH domain
MKRDAMTLGERIKKYRGEHNLTQIQFAKMCGISDRLISELEHDKRNPQAITKAKILKIIGGKK